MPAETHLFLCLKDNYGVLLHDPATGATAAIDAPDAGPVEAALAAKGWRLTDILVTHHHHDHVGGIEALKAKHKCRVVAPREKKAKIPGVDETVGEGGIVKVGSLSARVFETPGHTLDHISYWFEEDKIAFVADTLFSVGCGRVIEGTMEMMWDSLVKLRALPDDTRLYCGHEYTAANVRFALTVEPDNAALRARADEVAKQIEQKQPTVPTTMRAEKTYNPFLRADIPAVAAGIGMKDASPAQVFATIRGRKDKF